MPKEWDKDCPKCGDTTTVKRGSSYNYRGCDNDGCNWCVDIIGPFPRGRSV